MSTIDTYKERGRQAFSRKEYKKAAKIYRDALARFGDDAVLYSNRAQCFIFLEDWARALKDAEDGLRCDTDQGIKTKLLFRKGIALKHSNSSEAARCFQKVLDLSPSNASAQAELDSITDLQKSKKQKVDKGFELNVEVVEELPAEYRMDVVAAPAPKSSDLQMVEDVAKELFGDNQKEAPAVTDSSAPAADFASMPSMHYLKSLRTVPTEKKQSAYSLVLNLDNSVLASLFQSSGVDVDFYEFFLEAALHNLDSNLDIVSTYIAKLEYMSTFNRHQLTLSMCDKSLMNEFLRCVKQKWPDLSARAHKVFI